MKLSKIAKISLIVSVIGVLGLSSVALGQAPEANIPGVSNKYVGPSTVGGIVEIIRNVVRWVYILFFILAVLFILFAAFTYLTAGGDTEKVEKAKNQIIYAAVAIAVALLAVGFEIIIRSFLANPTA
ncbi:hypothetical protein JW698_01200 [Candidatus Wolfebacteria bacterium]|nr:hypothetical protein [Candidatus Wolfebacteria bacterium]